MHVNAAQQPKGEIILTKVLPLQRWSANLAATHLPKETHHALHPCKNAVQAVSNQRFIDDNQTIQRSDPRSVSSARAMYV